MSEILLCKNHQEIKCPLAVKCRRATESPSRHQKYLIGDYWANTCNSFIEILSDQERRYEINNQRIDLYNDLKC
jgi:hypothetical protein